MRDTCCLDSMRNERHNLSEAYEIERKETGQAPTGMNRAQRRAQCAEYDRSRKKNRHA